MNDVSSCISIISSDVILDGAGYVITGQGSGYGVIVSSSIALRNVTVKNLTVTGWESGIFFNNVLDSSIININASSNSWAGIYIESSSGSALNNNIADLNGNYGIYFYSSDNNTLVNNSASSSNNTGIYLLYSNNNTLTNSTASSNGENGVYLDFSNTNILISNIVRSNIYRGINLYFSNRNILVNNTILNSTDGIAVDEIMEGSSSGNSITSNRVYNTTDHGIILIRSFNNIISQNNVSFNSGEGMVLQDSWNNIISNNTANSNGQCGICLLYSSSNILTNNTANSNTIGINLNSSGGNILNNNIVNSNNNYGIHVSGEATSYTIPEVPFRFINVDVSNASSAPWGTIRDYGNYTLRDDNNYFIYELPFTFPFMSRNITEISANTNGLIELLESGESCYEGCADFGTHYDKRHIGNMDAIFASNGDIRPDVSEDTYLGVFNFNDKVVIEWYGSTDKDKDSYGYNLSSNPVHFQVVMHPNGTIEWNFKTMNFSSYDFDMFTGVYAKEENVEVVGGYAINTRKSLAINLSTSLPVSEYNIIRGNRISNNNVGIYLESSNNTIYNNYFNNTNNAIARGSNTWNINRTIGSNIADGPYLAGNFWEYPNGTGFSQECTDANNDGICDLRHMFNSSNIDYLPLARFLRKTSTSITVNADINANQTIEISPEESLSITNSVVELNATIDAPVILRINASKDASALNAAPATPFSGLNQNEQSIGRYIEVNVTGIDSGSLNFVNVSMYYTAADLDRTGDGDTNDPEDLNEQMLRMYWFNPNATTDSERWKPLGPGIEPGPDYTALGGPRVLGSKRDTTAKYLKVTLNHFSTFALAAESISSPHQPENSGSSGSGGGGGGGTSGENYTNIEVKERYYLYIFKDKMASYAFSNRSNPVMFINITGNTSTGEIATVVEVLKGASTLVKSAAPGIVYKNVNIWVGTAGFASPRNIREATILFRVENSWLDTNNLTGNEVKLVKWDGSKWVQLETMGMIKDNTYTRYEARTNSFSPFAITAIKGVESTVAVIQPEETAEAAGTASEKAPQVRLALIVIMFALIAVIAALYRMSK